MTPTDRTRYCHQCGATFAGPIAERRHQCADVPPVLSPWVRNAQAGRLPASDRTNGR